MRDPKRIDRVLQLIGGVWKQYLDFRLMQLLHNAVGEGDQFYLEDDKLEEKLRAYAKRLTDDGRQ